MPILRYGDREVAFSLTETRRLKSKILIHVRPNGEIEVETPLASKPSDVRSAIQKRARWIFDNLNSASGGRSYAIPREYVGGEAHFYLGRRYRLDVLKDAQRPSVKLVGGALRVIAPATDRAAIKKLLSQWYRVRAGEYFSKRLAHLVSEIEWLKVPPEMRLLAMRRQWGSCSPSGSIILNPALIRAPRQCIDYVLLHELCHLKEHNHSKRFYSLLERKCPGWKATKFELDGIAELLLSDH